MDEWKGEYWNTRLVEKINHWKSDINSTEYYNTKFVVHEVHYDKDHNIIAWTSEPMVLDFENYDEAKTTIKHLKDALKRTVLKYEGDKLVDTGKYLKQYKEDDLTNYNPEKIFEELDKLEEEE